nr:HD domain-containing protein [uncultured Treponema sp.]
MSVNIQKAIVFATQKHEGQKRKGTDIPYIVHPMEVMQILTDMNCEEAVIIAGILHDTLEDTDTTPEEIREAFGENILAIVQTESEDKSKTWKERKQRTVDELTEASTESKQVCFADKLSNIRSMYRDKLNVGEKIWERFNADKNNIAWYYRSIANALKNNGFEATFNTERGKQLFREFQDIINLVFSGL